MADNIPSLGEIANMRIDPELSGVAPSPVIDNTKLVEQLNNNARFHAQQVANKYNTFLQNKKDLFANIGDIQGLDSLAEDKPVLQKQAADILEQISKDPSVITGGTGFNDVQSKMIKFKSDAMAAKQKYLSDKADRLLLQTTPEMDTPENRKLLQDYVNGGLNAKPPILNTPTIMDERSIFEKTLADSTHPYSEAKDGYIESGFEFNPTAFSKQWNLVGGQTDKNNKLLSGAIKYNYDHLPSNVKDKYEEKGGGGIEQYWKDRGQMYLNAHLPQGSYDATPLVYDDKGNLKSGGNYRFGKITKVDPSFYNAERLELEKQKLAEKTATDKARVGIALANLGISREKLNRTKAEDQYGASTVINQLSNVIKNGKEVKVEGENKSYIRISDPTVLQEFSKLAGRDEKIGAMDFDKSTNQVLLRFYDLQQTESGKNLIVRTVPMDQRAWAKIVTKESFPNKDIGGINSLVEDALQKNNGSIYDISQKQGKEQDSGSKPIELKGKVDPSTLKKGSTYSVNGKSYIWDGKKLKAQ